MTSAKYQTILERESQFNKTNSKNHLTFAWDKFAYSPKRKSTTKNFLVSLFAIIASLFVSLFIAMAVYTDGSLFYRVIEQMFIAPFNSSNWKTTLGTISIFVISALSFIFAQKVGLFNIGISGQMLFGAQLATLMAWYIPNIPNVAGQLLVVLVSMVGGMFVATLVGALKVFLNINEVISAIMFNWIVYYCGSYMLNSVGTGKFWPDGTSVISSSGVDTSALLNNLQVAVPKGHGILTGYWLPLVIIMVVVLIASVLLISFSVFGKKVSSVGLSSSASQYAGINVKSKQLVTMAISGLLAGLLGAMIYCSGYGALPVTVTDKAIPQYGFNGISVGLIAMTNPIGVVPVSLLFGMVDTSKSAIQQVCAVDPTITNLMFGIILYGAAIISVFYYFTPWIWLKQLFYTKAAKKAYHEYCEEIRKSLSNCNNSIASVIQLRKAKREFLRLKWDQSNEMKKFMAEYKKHHYYKHNKIKFKTEQEFYEYCMTYMYAYMRIYANFADMHGRVPAHLKSYFHKARKQLYKRFGFKWTLLDKIAKTRHCVNSQRIHLNEIFSSPNLQENFKMFGIDEQKLNNKDHIKRTKAKMWRYYVLCKTLAKIEFNAIVAKASEAKLDAKQGKYLLEENQDSKFTKVFKKKLKDVERQARKFFKYNNSLHQITLRFKLRDIMHCQYINSVHETNLNAKVHGYIYFREMLNLVTDRLINTVCAKARYNSLQIYDEEKFINDKKYGYIYLKYPGLVIKKSELDNDQKIKTTINVKAYKDKLYHKLKKYIMKKEAYVLIAQLIRSKIAILNDEIRLIHIYEPHIYADMKHIHKFEAHIGGKAGR